MWTRAARYRLGVILLFVLTVMAAGRATPAAASLREVDWNTVLTTDPRVRVFPDMVPPPLLGPYLTVDTGTGEVAGYAATSDVLYGDLDLDGDEEAVIPVQSGGVSGLTGFLLYEEVNGRPRLVAAVPGYRLGLSIRDGVLIVQAPRFAGFEPDCCPSATVYTFYVVTGGILTAIGERVQPNGQAQAITVIAFYQALNERRYADAYALLSPAYQARTPFESWVAGYVTVERISVEQARGGLLPDAVVVTITVVDRLPTGGTVTRRFGGTWFLVWSPSRLHWLLDRADPVGGP